MLCDSLESSRPGSYCMIYESMLAKTVAKCFFLHLTTTCTSVYFTSQADRSQHCACLPACSHPSTSASALSCQLFLLLRNRVDEACSAVLRHKVWSYVMRLRSSNYRIHLLRRGITGSQHLACCNKMATHCIIRVILEKIRSNEHFYTKHGSHVLSSMQLSRKLNSKSGKRAS
jgi:hypothetical protein